MRYLASLRVSRPCVPIRPAGVLVLPLVLHIPCRTYVVLCYHIRTDVTVPLPTTQISAGHTPMAWEGSDRNTRLPADWRTHRAPHVMRTHAGICHLCGDPGSDVVDHIHPGDDHSYANLAPVHQDVPPYCHRYKSSREGNDARRTQRQARTRTPEPHPLDRKA